MQILFLERHKDTLWFIDWCPAHWTLDRLFIILVKLTKVLIAILVDLVSDMARQIHDLVSRLERHNANRTITKLRYRKCIEGTQSGRQTAPLATGPGHACPARRTAS